MSVPLNNICDSCPHGAPQSLVSLLPGEVREDVLQLMSSSDDTFEDLVLWISLGILGEQEPLEPTLVEMRKCLKEIWDTGKGPEGECDTQNTNKITCFRKHLFEETIIYFKQLWLKSGKNQEQFQALLRDTWTLFKVSLLR